MTPVSHLHYDEVKEIIERGAGIVVSAGAFSGAEIGEFAHRLRGSAVLHVTSSSSLSKDEMKAIAYRAHAPAYVMFSGKA